MRTIIEVSAYMLVMTVVCFVSLDFIIINKNVCAKQQTIDYIRDYVELYGMSTESGAVVQGGGKVYALNQAVIDSVKEIADESGITVDIKYRDSNSRHCYYEMKTEYDICLGTLKISDTHRSSCLVRTEMEQDV